MTTGETSKVGASGLVAGGAAIAVALGVLGWWMSQDKPVEIAEDPIAKVTAEPIVPDAATVDTAEPDVSSPSAVVPPPISPRFDVVRVEPDGSSVIAGQAEPGAQVELMLDGQKVNTTQADANGNFVAMLTLKPSDAPRVMTLMVDGEAIKTSEQSVIVGPTIEPKPATETAAATEVLVAPEPDGGPATTAPEVVAEAPVEIQEAPQVLLADEGGISVIQDAGGTTVSSDISLDSISYDEQGLVALAGRGTAQETVLIYLDDVKVAKGAIAGNGQWRVTLKDISAGIYTLRIEALDAASKVVSRLETPFKREDPAQLAALSQGPAGAPVEDATESQSDSATQTTPAEDTTVTEGAVTDTPADEGAVVSGATPAADAAKEGGDATVGASEDMRDERPATAPSAGDENTEIAQINDGASEPVATAPATDQPDGTAAPADGANAAEDIATNPAPERPRVITVQAGATLWAIARENLGEGTLYVQVFDANRDKISNPDLIYPGQVFAVPATQ